MVFAVVGTFAAGFVVTLEVDTAIDTPSLPFVTAVAFDTDFVALAFVATESTVVFVRLQVCALDTTAEGSCGAECVFVFVVGAVAVVVDGVTDFRKAELAAFCRGLGCDQLADLRREDIDIEHAVLLIGCKAAIADLLGGFTKGFVCFGSGFSCEEVVEAKDDHPDECICAFGLLGQGDDGADRLVEGLCVAIFFEPDRRGLTSLWALLCIIPTNVEAGPRGS